MQTTSIYIELVIIGAQVLTWVFTIFALIDDRIVSALKNGLSSVPIAIMLLGLCYVVGVVFDRIAEWVFHKPEKKIRRKQEVPEDIITHHLFVPKDGASFDYFKSGTRIVRGTILNVLPATIAASIYLIVHHFSIAIAVAIFISGFLFCALCLVVYHRIVFTYYKRVKKYMTAGKVNESALIDDAD